MTTIIPKPQLVRVPLLMVAEYYGVTFTDMQSLSRRRTVVLARRVSIAILRRLYPQATNSQIAEMFGRDNPTFVTESVQALNDEVSVNPILANDVKAIMERILESQGVREGERPNS